MRKRFEELSVKFDEWVYLVIGAIKDLIRGLFNRPRLTPTIPVDRGYVTPPWGGKIETTRERMEAIERHFRQQPILTPTGEIYDSYVDECCYLEGLIRRGEYFEDSRALLNERNRRAKDPTYRKRTFIGCRRSKTICI